MVLCFTLNHTKFVSEPEKVPFSSWCIDHGHVIIRSSKSSVLYADTDTWTHRYQLKAKEVATSTAGVNVKVISKFKLFKN